MTSEEIIKKNIRNNEGPFSGKELRKRAIRRIRTGQDTIFRCGDMVFTVGVDFGVPIVHIYSNGVGTSIFKSCKKFMDRVWKETNFKFLTAPIQSKKVAKLAERFGWKSEFTSSTGTVIYKIERAV